jgi:membrane-bound lytic murein transglycosylase D
MRISVCFIVVFLSACSHLGSIANTNEPPEQHGTDIASSDNDSNDNASNNSDSNDDSLIAGQQGSQAEHAHSPDSGSISRDTFDSPNFGLARLTCDHPFEPANNDSLLLSYWPLEEAHASRSESITESDETGTTQSDIWDRIRSGFALDLSVKNKRIDVQFNWYQRNPKYIERTFNRASRYMYHIVEALEQHNMPLELALLPVVESAFDPFAYSHGRASGLWQFIPGTGKMYGMHQNWWYDGRRDVLASTQGAIDYLSFLNRRFQGNWLHALASYNTGSGRVAKAIRKNKKRGKATDFWHLKLPRETRAYVPKLLAISKLVADPERYGIALPSIPNRPVFDVVTFDSQLDLAQAANLAGIDIQELYRLNPGFNQWATPPQGPHRLLLPIEATQAFKENLAKLPKNSRVSWSRYSVKSGDSLIKIAKRFHTTPALIKQVNRLKNNTIRVKQKLLIPVASKKHEFYDLSSNNRLANKQQRIRAPKDTVKITHVVKEGDTMWDLSLKHKVGMRSIAKWNGMAPTDVLKPGRSLLIYSKTANSVANEPETPFIPGERQMIRRVGYKVRRGDSLARIANKFGVTVHQLVSWNKIDRKKYLQPGQKLTIYVDITRG